MRSFVSLLLVAFLVACPQLCRAETLGCCADGCEERSEPDDDSRPPEPSQDEAVSCICAGAIRGSSSQNDAKANLGDGSPVALPPAFLPTALGLTAPIAGGGAPPGWSICGPLRIHLMLQILRC